MLLPLFLALIASKTSEVAEKDTNILFIPVDDLAADNPDFVEEMWKLFAEAITPSLHFKFDLENLEQ